jgi:hypothetical protein
LLFLAEATVGARVAVASRASPAANVLARRKNRRPDVVLLIVLVFIVASPWKG